MCATSLFSIGCSRFAFCMWNLPLQFFTFWLRKQWCYKATLYDPWNVLPWGLTACCSLEPAGSHTQKGWFLSLLSWFSPSQSISFFAAGQCCSIPSVVPMDECVCCSKQLMTWVDTRRHWLFLCRKIQSAVGFVLVGASPGSQLSGEQCLALQG